MYKYNQTNCNGLHKILQIKAIQIHYSIELDKKRLELNKELKSVNTIFFFKLI